MQTALSIHASIRQPQPLHRPPMHQVLFHNLRRIRSLHMAIPNGFGINDNRGPVFALIQAARFVDPHRRPEPSGLRELLQLREELALAIAGTRWPRCVRGTSVLADKDMMFKRRQAIILLFKWAEFKTVRATSFRVTASIAPAAQTVPEVSTIRCAFGTSPL